MSTIVSPSALRLEVEDFLIHDAALLDEWRLEEWLERFTPTCRYIVPATDCPDGNPSEDLQLIHDDWFLLQQRVKALMDGSAWAENPRSTTMRVISNVRVQERDDGDIDADANLVVHRSRRHTRDVYPARLRLHLIRAGDGGFQIEGRTAVLALDELRPNGRLSILL